MFKVVSKNNIKTRPPTILPIRPYLKPPNRNISRIFEIYRYNTKTKPYIERIQIDTSNTPMVLDALLKIKNTIDPTLSFRRSCREGICGSCAMNINGSNTLACLCTINSKTPKEIRIYPLPHQPVIKDLVCDMNNFYEQHKYIEPWLQIPTELEKQSTEILQSKNERDLLDGLYECILCACCSTSCPSYWWHGHDTYLGPAVLLQAYRWLVDSRDKAYSKRIKKLLADEHHIFACHSILNCTLACPRNLNPGRIIGTLKNMALDYNMDNKLSSSPILYTALKAKPKI